MSTRCSTWAYPFYDQFHGKLPLFGQVEDRSATRHLHATAGYKHQVLDPCRNFSSFARDELHVNYVFWVRLPNANPADSYDWLDAVPVMGANPTFN